MKRILFALFSLIFVALEVPVVTAEELPAMSFERLAVGAGANYVGRFQGGEEPLPSPDHEWEGGLYAAYTLVPRAALVGSVERGWDTKRLEYLPGINVRLTSPGAPIAFGLKAAYRMYDGDPVPTYDKEWIVGMTAAKRLQSWLLLTGSLDYGLDNQHTKLAAGLRVAHSFAKGGY